MTVDINNISHETNDANMIYTNDMGKSKRDGNIYMSNMYMTRSSCIFKILWNTLR